MSLIDVDENIVVGSPQGRELKVDVFRPANPSGPVPALLFLPGGGWRNADRAALKDRYGVRVAQRGYVCVTGEYRVMDEAPWPAQVQDVKAIIRWVRAHSESLGIEPSAIVVGGKSAGGHLALLAAGATGVEEFEGEGDADVSSAVAAVVGVAPVSDMADPALRGDVEALFGANASVDVVKAASPISYVNASYPPTLLLHGTADRRVPHYMTLRLYRALEEAGVPVDLHLYAGQDHPFDREPQFSEAIADAIALFIARYVPVPSVAGAS